MPEDDADHHERPPEPEDSLVVPPADDAVVRQRQEQLDARAHPITPSDSLAPGVLISARFVGPLPPPSMLAQYDRTIPGLANRIVGAWERESAHRRSLESASVHGELRLQHLGVVFGFVIALAGFGVASWLGFLGHPATAAIVGGLDLTALVSVFVLGRALQRPDSESPESSEEHDP